MVNNFRVKISQSKQGEEQKAISIPHLILKWNVISVLYAYLDAMLPKLATWLTFPLAS